MVSDPKMNVGKRRRLAPSEKYEIYVAVLTGQATQREAAERFGVDRSTVVHVCRTAKQGALALWWQYLTVFGLDWDAVRLSEVGGFLAWLRTGDGPGVTSIQPRPARFGESTIAVRLAAVMSCYGFHELNGVRLGGDLRRLVHSRGGRYLPLLE